MANNWALCHAAIISIMEEISEDVIRQVHKSIPDAIVTDCEAVVLMMRARHGQLGTALREERHYPYILLYAPCTVNPDAAEDKLIVAWDAMVAKFTDNVTLNSTASRSRLGSYRAGWETVGGQKCRMLRAPLEAHITQTTAYAA